MSISDVVAIMVAIVGIVPTIAKGVKSILDHNFEVKVIIITALIVSIICAGFVSAAVFIAKATTIEINGHTTVPIPGFPAATKTPTAAPSLTPTLRVLQINKTMTIIGPQAAASFFSLIVKTATIDPARMQVTLLIGLQNNGTSAVGEHLNYLRFQDQITGDTTDGAGEGFTDIDFAPGQTILFRPTFPFTPVAGRTYQLSAQLGDFYDFRPITITF